MEFEDLIKGVSDSDVLDVIHAIQALDSEFAQDLAEFIRDTDLEVNN